MRFLVLVLLVSLAHPVAAQRVPQPPFAPLLAGAAMHRTTALDSAAIPKTHWLEGALFGGAALGLLFAEGAAGFCADTDSGGGHNCGLATVEGFFLGAGLGFTIGGLIGGQFPKR